jgi:hypothetical protein
VQDLRLDLEGIPHKLQDLIRYEYPVVINQSMTAHGYMRANVAGPDEENPNISASYTVKVHRFIQQVSGVNTITVMIERYPYVNAKGHRKEEVK